MDVPSFILVTFVEPPGLVLVLLWVNQFLLSTFVAGLVAEMAAADDARSYRWAIPVVLFPIVAVPVFLRAVRELKLRRGYDDHRGRWARRRAYAVAVAVITLLVVAEAIFIVLFFGAVPAIRTIGAPRPSGYF